MSNKANYYDLNKGAAAKALQDRRKVTRESNKKARLDARTERKEDREDRRTERTANLENRFDSDWADRTKATGKFVEAIADPTEDSSAQNIAAAFANQKRDQIAKQEEDERKLFGLFP